MKMDGSRLSKGLTAHLTQKQTISEMIQSANQLAW